VVRLLLANGADVNARGGHYGTALQAAAAGGKLEAVKLLLQHGADPLAAGGKFGSALEAAQSALGGKQPHYHVANYLRRHLAKVEAQEAPAEID
jgi:ankyrin repeat protein